MGIGESDITLGPESKLIGYTDGGWGDPYDIIDAQTMPTHIGHGYFNNIPITPLSTAIYFNLNPNPASVGQKVTLKGILVDEFSQPLSSETVRLYARPLAGSWTYITSLTTNGRGIFNWQATIPMTGIFVFAVYYPGSEMYESTYNLAALIVQ